MAALRIALSINCPRHLRISYEKFAAAAKAIEAAMLADRLQAMCDEPAADDPNAEPPADDRNSDPLYGERMDSADCGEN